MKKANFFDFAHLEGRRTEQIELLTEQENAFIERIVSNGQASPEGFWYQQDTDEWVMLAQGTARISFEKDDDVFLEKGDFLFIPAGKKHRVEEVSADENAVWLAVHLKK